MIDNNDVNNQETSKNRLKAFHSYSVIPGARQCQRISDETTRNDVRMSRQLPLSPIHSKARDNRNFHESKFRNPHRTFLHANTGTDMSSKPAAMTNFPIGRSVRPKV